VKRTYILNATARYFVCCAVFAADCGPTILWNRHRNDYRLQWRRGAKCQCTGDEPSVGVTNVDTNVAVVAKTNGAGVYVANNLIVGTYRVEAETPGF
jgi:hypothetical protein